jgi:NADH-quinone oxidoreductase subunit J
MSASAIIFYIIAAFILGSALFAMTTRKIFRSAIWLLFSLLGIAALYFWLQVEFIAAVQIAVYVGGIVVLIIFSVFLTQQSGKEMPKTPLARKVAAVLAVLVGFGLTATVIYLYHFEAGSQPFDWSVAAIGSQMLNTGKGGFALPFEAVSMLLLAAMLGCIVIAMRSSTQPLPRGKEIEPSQVSALKPIKTENKIQEVIAVEENEGGTVL